MSESALPAVSQDSVCRLLMRVEPLQPLLVSFLLSQLTEHSDEEIAPNSSSSSSLTSSSLTSSSLTSSLLTSSSSSALLNALLNQLRWTDFLTEASPLIPGLLETLAVRRPAVFRVDLLAVAAARTDSAAARPDRRRPAGGSRESGRFE